MCVSERSSADVQIVNMAEGIYTCTADRHSCLAAAVTTVQIPWCTSVHVTDSSDVFLQNVTRRSEWCKSRHAQIMKAGEAAAAAAAEQNNILGPDGQPLDPNAGAAGIQNLANLTKHQVSI